MIAPRQSFADRMQSIQQSPMQGSQNNGEPTNAPAKLPNQIQQSADQQQLNQDAPMGDPVDTIAQMLGLDLSAAASPDQQGQMVVSAVESLVLQLHQYVDQFGMLNGQEADDQPDDQLQNYEDDGNEGGENNEGQEGTDTTEADEESVDEQDNPSTSKQQFPPKKKSGIAASFFDGEFATPAISNRALNALKKGRELELLQLARDGFISPVMLKQLQQEFCSSDSLALSLSQDDGLPDEFDSVVSRFKRNGKLLELGSETFGAQDGYRTLSHAKREAEEASPLVAAAESRREQEEKKRARASGR